MADARKLERERLQRVKAEGKKFGLNEGTYRVARGDGDFDWYEVEITFYPKVKWWIQQLRGLMDHTPISNTRRELSADDPIKGKLETWL